MKEEISCNYTLIDILLIDHIKLFKNLLMSMGWKLDVQKNKKYNIMSLKDFIKILHKKGLVLGDYHKVRLQRLPINTTNFSSLNLSKLCKFEPQLLKHPIWLKLHYDSKTNSIIINFTNETAQQLKDNHMLLGKIALNNTSVNIVTQGFTNNFSLNDSKQLKELFSLLNSFNHFPKHKSTHSQPFDINLESKINFQDLRMIEHNEYLIDTFCISAMPINKLTDDSKTDQDIITGHSSITNKNTNNKHDHYLWTQNEHFKGANNGNNSLSEQTAHSNIAKAMDFVAKNGNLIWTIPP